MAYGKQIESSQKINLKDYDADDDGGLDKEAGIAKATALGKELDELQDLMFFAGQHSLLLVLQGMDTSGKDGTIRFLFQNLSGQGCRVAPFKVPTPEELGHDFLWRVHMQTPKKGQMVIFNRSHYEDVLVVRVHKIVSDETCKERYELINRFEQLLARNNTIIVKCYLHITNEEQENRLLDREKEVEKSWKLSVGDWKERELWENYELAYEDAIGNCAHKDAPWIIVPANRKWFRNLVVIEAIVDALRPYRKVWTEHLEKIGETAKMELAEYRKLKPLQKK